MKVLISGGTRGIGLSIASLFSTLPQYSVTVLSRSPPASPLPYGVTSLQGDTSSPSFWSQLMKPTDRTKSFSISPHVLINAAGVSQYSLLMRTSAKDVDAMIDTNLKGTIWATKAVSRIMIKNSTAGGSYPHGPVIINISSLLGVRGGIGTAVYAASKAGVLGFTRATALELGRSGIRVNAIVPGYIDTQMTSGMSDEARSSALAQIPMKKPRFGTPEEIAEAALFLAKNEYANNCVINLDGGLSAV